MTEPVNMLCIRDPDFENTYVADAPINEITIDIGGQWNSLKDFASCLQEGEEEALAFEDSILAEVNDLPIGNPVREAVYEFFQFARER